MTFTLRRTQSKEPETPDGVQGHRVLTGPRRCLYRHFGLNGVVSIGKTVPGHMTLHRTDGKSDMGLFIKIDFTDSFTFTNPT